MKNKMMKSLMAMVMATSMFMSVIPCVASEKAASITLTGWGSWTFEESTGNTSYSNQFLWKEVAERLGINVEWTTVPSADKSAKFSLMMSDAANLPDIVVDMDPLTYEEFGRDGAFITLNEYINEETMPNLWNLLEEYPDALASITSADGNIYFFPRIMEESTRYWAGTFMREDFLEEVGLGIPTTIDEFYQALVAIKEGIDTVEYPLSIGMDSLKTFVWSWEVGARGRGTGTTDDAYIKDGKIAYGPTDDAYREALIWLNQLYEEELLNPDWNSLQDSDMRTNILNKATAVAEGSFSGIMSTYNSLLKEDGQGEVLTTIEPLIGPNGFQTRQGHHTAIDVSYGLGVTASCSDIDATIRMIDYLYSDEGRELVYYGVEGETFTKDGDTYTFTENVTTSDLGVLTYLNNYSANTSCYPTAMLTEFYHSTLSEKAQAGNVKTTEIGEANDIRMPALRYDEDEISKINVINTDLNAYVDEYFANFVNGVYDVTDDGVWQEYLKGFDSLRLEELLSYYQAAYERWVSAME